MINMEKIDAVIAATGCDYPTVRQALLATNGDVREAIRLLLGDGEQATASEQAKQAEQDADQTDQTDRADQESKKSGRKADYHAQLDDIVNTIKEIWQTGNASSLIVEKDGKTILNLSLTVSAFVLILAPFISLIGLGTAILTEYKISIRMVNGEVIDVLAYNLQHGGSRQRYQAGDATDASADASADASDNTDL